MAHHQRGANESFFQTLQTADQSTICRHIAHLYRTAATTFVSTDIFSFFPPSVSLLEQLQHNFSPPSLSSNLSFNLCSLGTSNLQPPSTVLLSFRNYNLP